MSATTHCLYRNDLAELNRLAVDIERFAADNNMDPSVAHAFNLCLDELFTNIVSYGFAPGEHHEIKLELRATPHEFVAILRDDAKPFDPLTQAPQPDLHAPIEHRKIGGLGVYFVKTLMSRVHYRREHNWNVIEMASARQPSEP